MTSELLILNGTSLIADLSGVIFWPDRSLLVVSDLHLEKGSGYAAKGIHLPPYDTADTLNRLTAGCVRYRPETVICLGDNFHDVGGPSRMAAADRARLETLVTAHDWCWITGNHDPELPDDLPGQRMAEMSVGPLIFRHEASRQPVDGEISGHYHPTARIPTRQRQLTGRCFAFNGRRLIMPAFGALTGGLNTRDAAIRAILGNSFDIFFLGPKRLYRFTSDKLC